VLELARPAYLLAGGLLALVPIALHLIARRPPRRAPLPTARFVRPDPRTAVRLRRRPSDLLLLALRCALLLLLGAAFAGPSWRPAPAGTVEVVLLDRGAGIGGAWAEAVDSARALVLGGGAAEGRAESGRRGAGRELVLFDTAAVRVPAAALDAAFFDSLAAAGPGDSPIDYAAALRGLVAAVRARPGFDSAGAVLVTRPRWEGWSPGLARLREAAWPGAIRVVGVGGELPVQPAAVDGPVDRGVPGIAMIHADRGGEYVTAALEALGWTVERGSENFAADRAGPAPALHVVLGPVSTEVEAALAESARAGATVVLEAGVSAGAAGGSGVGGATGTLRFAGGAVLDGAVRRGPIAIPPGARLLAAWDDGAPAAVAVPEGEGCRVELATRLEEGRLPLAPAFPAALDRLARGCDDGQRRPAAAGAGGAASNGGGRPLDAGALAVLEGRGHPAAVGAADLAAAGFGSDDGRPLGRWILLAAIAVAAVETWLARRRGAGRRVGSADETVAGIGGTGR